MSDCYVTAKDYRRHRGGEIAIEESAPVWSGDERRVGLTDRRLTGHDRRWNNERGRRYRLWDRRKVNR